MMELWPTSEMDWWGQKPFPLPWLYYRWALLALLLFPILEDLVPSSRTVPPILMAPESSLALPHSRWCGLSRALTTEGVRPRPGWKSPGQFAWWQLVYVLAESGKPVTYPRATTCLSPLLPEVFLLYPIATSAAGLEPHLGPYGLAQFLGEEALLPTQSSTVVLLTVV